ncbi:MAG: leucine--tRNA ligase [Anaerolineae bacterium]
MARRYDPREIEPKWQQRWERDGLYTVSERSDKPALYFLTMYPYPSGDLHIGHWYAMAPSDAAARYRRMRGYNIFFPIGFDAFGLPAENAAIRRNIHPREWTYKNIDNMRQQLRSMGTMFDWTREVVTCDPDYFKWNQWFFLKFYEMGLVYKTFAPVDWCPQCNTTLAREQVWGEDRRCERCETPVTKKELDQWLFRITNYAEQLLEGLDRIDWPERVRTMQRNWIGKSRGADIIFRSERGDEISVFTTRPDTVYGATFMVLAPEHPLVDELTTGEYRDDVEVYKARAMRATEIERLAVDKEKTGVFTGAYAINPVNDERIPIWIADYVLMTYGSGAIMAVPSGDERDFIFARKYDLPIVPVVIPADEYEPGDRPAEMEEAFTGPGIMVNSGPFDGTPSMGKYWPDEWTPELANEWGLPAQIEVEGKQAVINMLEGNGQETLPNGAGNFAIGYRLRDWLISRQRYWGTPIPMIHCPECGTVPVPYDELPIELPDDVDFMPTGESPLKNHAGFRFTTCPRCGGQAERDTDTMDTFVDSSWYQYRYLNPHYDEGPFDPEIGEYWLPVDQYTGGVEHATMHLLYTRFWTKVMHDMGLIDFDEPMVRLFNQGTILGEDGEKMSKSRGNVVDPDDLVGRYGADTVRAYLMFIGPWEQGGPWSAERIAGIVRWLNDVWAIVVEGPRSRGAGEHGSGGAGERGSRGDFPDTPAPHHLSPPAPPHRLRRVTHQTIRKVTQDLDEFAFNTAISALMTLRNELKAAKSTTLYGSDAWNEAIRSMLLLMAPFTPHIAEELWVHIGGEYSIHTQAWPAWDEEIAAEDTFTLVIQINGKTRDKTEVPVGISDEQAKKLALASEKVQHHLDGGEPERVIYVPGRLVNIVAR